MSNAWGSWRLLVEWRKENEVVAREHAARALAYLLAVRGHTSSSAFTCPSQLVLHATHGM